MSSRGIKQRSLQKAPAGDSSITEDEIKRNLQESSIKETSNPLDKVPGFKAFMDNTPSWLKEGPWSPVTHLFLLSFSIFLALHAKDAMISYSNLSTFQQIKEEPGWLQYYRLFFGSYGLIVSIGTLVVTGLWVMGSYTMCSWNFMTFRLLASFLNAQTGCVAAKYVADLTRFPALVGCSITVTVWWGILVPLIHSKIKGAARSSFWKMNLSAPLLNVHGLNLPIIAFEFFYSRVPLQFFDLWVGMSFAFVYIMFYLNVLDRNGLHFYIIFSPRTAGCVLSFAFVLALYFASYVVWNKALPV